MQCVVLARPPDPPCAVPFRPVCEIIARIILVRVTPMRSHPAQCGHLVEKPSILKVDVELLIPKIPRLHHHRRVPQELPSRSISGCTVTLNFPTPCEIAQNTVHPFLSIFRRFIAIFSANRSISCFPSLSSGHIPFKGTAIP